jgi:dihydroorotase
VKRLLLKKGRVLDPASKTDKVLDILIEDGKIKELAEDINLINQDTTEVYDVSNKLVTPGLIDVHVHAREPGREDEEDISSVSKAAASGGFTTILCMPNTQPPIDNYQVIEFIKAKSKACSLVNIEIIGAISKGIKGEILTDISQMVSAGIVGISDDSQPVMNSNLMLQALEYTKLVNIVVVSHPEDKSLTEGGVMNEGYISFLLGMPGMPKYAEEIMVNRDIILAKETKTRLHFAHISTKEALLLIKKAKEKDIPITCEVTPHHFTLIEDYIMSFDPNLKVNPPLRTKEDVEFIHQMIEEDGIDIIATDHAPHLKSEKELGFIKAPFGIIGLETALPLTITKLYKEKKIDLMKLIAKLTCNPAKIFNLKNKGALRKGYDADITIIDLNLKKKIEKFNSKCNNSPFLGWYLEGFPVMTIVAGKVVFNTLSTR